MSDIVGCIKARSFLTSLKILNNKDIAFATKLHGVKICSSDDCSVKLNFANQHLNSSTTAICFNNDGDYLAFANDKVIHIVNLLTKDIVKTIYTDNESIQLLAFDDTTTHLIAGSKNGRVLHYRIEGASLICRLCSFPYNRDKHKSIRQNYVSAFVFRKNILATTGYGGTIHIIDIHSRANTIVLENGIVRTNALCFLDDNTILSANFEGVIKLFHIKEKKLVKQLDTTLSRIRQINLMPNPNYAMICSHSNYISILDIKNFKLIHENYIEFEDTVTRIATLDEETILVALKNGQINKITLANEKQLASLILHNSLEKAFLLAQNEPMLQDTDEYIKLKTLYSNLYNEATESLINQNTSLASELLKPFENLKSKKKEINLLFIAFKHYDRLKIFFLEKKYTLAYAICAKYPELENTPIYKKMEEIFKEVFKNAQRQILLKQVNNAKALFYPYITIPAKKAPIELLLKQNKEFLQFIIAVDKKDYSNACLLIQKNKYLKNVPSYKILMNTFDKYIESIKNNIKIGNTNKAMEIIDIIKDVISLKSQIRIFKNDIKNLRELQKYYDNDNFKGCYQTLDKYHHLNKTELGTLLSKNWHKVITTCEAHALKGDVKAIKKVLGELIFLEQRADKIGDLFRVAYQIRVKTYIYKKSFNNAEKTIYAYIDTFGIDSEISTLMKKFESSSKKKLAITQNSNERVTRNNWINSALIMDA